MPMCPPPAYPPLQVRDLAATYYRETQRYYYATPTSYLELIRTYKDLLNEKRTTVRLERL